MTRPDPGGPDGDEDAVGRERRKLRWFLHRLVCLEAELADLERETLAAASGPHESPLAAHETDVASLWATLRSAEAAVRRRMAALGVPAAEIEPLAPEDWA
jgi:hypothetical protein